ncbi:MAG: ferredoxin reductase family protein [Micrococcales bacterium]|nr:ferredoxin reductase family protein [Micrococcales bacterium]
MSPPKPNPPANNGQLETTRSNRVAPWLVLLVIAVIGLIAVVWLWFSGNGTSRVGLETGRQLGRFRDHHGSGPFNHDMARLSGLLAGYATILLTLLMARFPFVERSLGPDQLARWHARLGVGAFALTAIHLASIPGHPNDWTIRLAHVAAATMALLAVTSIPVVRHRLPYSVWNTAHWVGYMGLWQGLMHQVRVGSDLSGNRWVAAAWIAAFTVGLIGLMDSRLFQPLVLHQAHHLRLDRVVEEAPGVVSVYITGQNLAALNAQAGQFFRWRFLTRGMWFSANPYSLSSVPDGQHLRITVSQVGGHSKKLAGLPTGTTVLVEGPSGIITPSRFTRQEVLLLAGGSGIGPARALTEALARAGKTVTLIYRCRSGAGLALQPELDQIAATHPAVQIHCLVGPSSDPDNALTAQRLKELNPTVGQADVFVCGPARFTKAARQAALAAGVPHRHIFSESISF